MDIASVTAVLGLANSAIGLTGKAASTAEAIKKMISKDGAPDKGETADLLNTLATELTAANMMNLQISEMLKVLSQELQRQDEFETEKARYEMFETSQGDMVFRLKTDSANGQPIHFICPVCLNRDKLISFVTGDQYFKRCQSNSKHGYGFQESPPYTGVY